MTPYVLGLTGPTGAGKSTVADYFRHRGCPVIDADQTARAVTAPGSRSLEALADAFSADILRPDGSLDRRRLAARAFADRQSTARLNAILHPLILDRLKKELKALSDAGYAAVLLDAPQLYEAGAEILCNRVAAVLAPAAQRMARIMKRDGLTRQEAEGRMAAGQPDSFFREKGAVILWNDGDMAALLEKARALYQEMPLHRDIAK